MLGLSSLARIRFLIFSMFLASSAIVLMGLMADVPDQRAWTWHLYAQEHYIAAKIIDIVANMVMSEVKWFLYAVAADPFRRALWALRGMLPQMIEQLRTLLRTLLVHIDFEVRIRQILQVRPPPLWAMQFFRYGLYCRYCQIYLVDAEIAQPEVDPESPHGDGQVEWVNEPEQEWWQNVEVFQHWAWSCGNDNCGGLTFSWVADGRCYECRACGSRDLRDSR